MLRGRLAASGQAPRSLGLRQAACNLRSRGARLLIAHVDDLGAALGELAAPRVLPRLTRPMGPRHRCAQR